MPLMDSVTWTQGVTRILALSLVLVAGGMACSGDGGEGPIAPEQPEDPETPSGDPDARLECDRRGYPCMPGDVASEIQRRSAALADSSAAMFANGMAGADVRNWIETREGVIEVSGDDSAVRFRLAGGYPMWAIDEHELAAALGSGALPATLGPAGLSRQVAANVVVGDSPDVKRALVLSPVAWELEGFDESPAVAALLSSTRGYEGRVQYLEVPTETSAVLPMSAFTGWDVFDVVHISTHGKTLCDDDGCRAMLVAVKDMGPTEALPAEWNSPGVVLGKSSAGYRYISLEADFFLHHYADGVGNAVVFASACQTLSTTVTDLANAVRGSGGIFLGWSAPVQTVPGAKAAIAFYTHLSETGATVGTAYASLGDLKMNIWTDDAGTTFNATLRVTERAAGGDLRIREVVWIENPAGGGPANDGASVKVEGTLGDGSPDAIPYRVRIDGVDSEPANFEVHVEIDGIDAEPMPLSAGEEAGDMSWVVTGELQMGRDLQDGDVVPIHAWVELPDVGESHASVAMELTDDPGYWVGFSLFSRESNPVGDFIEFAAAENLRFDFNPETTRYELTQGTLTWRQEGVVLNAKGQLCEFELLQMLTPEPGSAFISINPATGRYVLYGEADEPAVDVPTDCPDMSVKLSPAGPWLRTIGEDYFVSESGDLIQGESRFDFEVFTERWAWRFERREGS